MEVKHDTTANAMLITFDRKKRAKTIRVNPYVHVLVDENDYPILIELRGIDKYLTDPIPIYSGDDYITVEEAAAIMQVDTSRVRQLLLAGTLQGVKLGSSRGGHWMIPRESAEAWEPKPVGRPKKEPSEA